MSESKTETTPETAQPSQPTESSAGPKPPWGSDDEFNPEKAWSLIQNLRADLSNTKSSLDSTRTQMEAQVQGAAAKAQEAEEARAETEIALHRERAARTHRLNDEQAEFLAELTDPEQIAARAQKLAEMVSQPSVPDRAVDPTQGTTSKAKALNADPLLDDIKSKLGIR